MARRPRSDRKQLDQATPAGRWGAHLRELMDAKGLGAQELRILLVDEGHDVGVSAVRHWLRGETYPTHTLMESLGRILGLADYRHLLPPPHHGEQLAEHLRRDEGGETEGGMGPGGTNRGTGRGRGDRSRGDRDRKQSQ